MALACRVMRHFRLILLAVARRCCLCPFLPSFSSSSVRLWAPVKRFVCYDSPRVHLRYRRRQFRFFPPFFAFSPHNSCFKVRLCAITTQGSRRHPFNSIINDSKHFGVPKCRTRQQQATLLIKLVVFALRLNRNRLKWRFQTLFVVPV